MEAIKTPRNLNPIPGCNPGTKAAGATVVSYDGQGISPPDLDAPSAAVMLLSPRYRIIEATARLVHLLGYPTGQLNDRHFASICPDMDAPKFRKAFEAALTSAEDLCLMTALRKADGCRLDVVINAVWLDPSAGTVKLLIQKVFHRAASEPEAPAPEAGYDALFSANPNTVLRLDHKGVIRRLNQAIDVCGWTREELLGRPLAHILHSDDRHKLHEHLRSCASGKPAGSPLSARVRYNAASHCRPEASPTKAPEYRCFSISAAGIFLEDAAPSAFTGYWVILQDLSKEITAAAAIKRLETQLMQAQKLEAIGALASGIAHDFNNILSAVFGNAQLAQMALPSSHKAYEYIRNIQAAGHRAKNLVGQILAFNRSSSPLKKPVDLSRVVREAHNLLRAALPSNIEIQPEIKADGQEIMADPTQIHQVMMNLCTNALHALEGRNGRVNISLTAENVKPSSPEISPQKSPAGAFLKLAVSDNGCGMDSATVQQIFKPYFTTKEAGKGTGLGLPTVLAIVEDHGGSIRVHSEPGRGTRFTILFPCCTPQEDPPAQTKQTLHRGKERILFVDDENTLADLAGQMLSELGYEVDTKTCPLEALATFKKQPQAYQLVMTDMTMPGMTGTSLAEAIHRIRPQVPVLLCSGFINMLDPSQAAKMGIRGVLKKPFTLTRLSRKVREVLDCKDQE